MKTLKKLAFLFSITITVFQISACNLFSSSDDDDEVTSQPVEATTSAQPQAQTSTALSNTNTTSDNVTQDPVQTTPPQPTQATGHESTQYSGYVTYYTPSSTAFFTPEIESGWYQCAVSEYKYSTFPAGSAIQITANGKTINVLVTDLCPISQVPNGNGMTNENYYFTLEESAFIALADKSVGILNMTCKTIPYPTEKSIGFIASDNSQYYLKGRFYNMRYPLKNIEYSFDGGTTFNQMQAVDPGKTNFYSIDNGLIPQTIIFRLTDIYSQTVTTSPIQPPAKNEKISLGVNFPY